MTNKLREMQEEKGMTWEELAEKSGVSRATISSFRKAKVIFA